MEDKCFSPYLFSYVSPVESTLSTELPKRLQLIQQRVEAIHRGLDRLRRGHIHPGGAQQVDRGARGAAAQEGQVAVDCWLAFVGDLAAERQRRREAGGILVDIKAGVEMRDARPLKGDLVIERDTGAVVALHQVVVDLAKRIGCQRLAGLGALVNIQL